MANIEFTRQDIVTLIRKLSQLEPYFTDDERKLLLAIFGAAADRAKSSGPSGATLPEAESLGQAPAVGAAQQTTITVLQQQLLSAYIPGNSFGSVTQSGATFSITEDPASITQTTTPAQPGSITQTTTPAQPGSITQTTTPAQPGAQDAGSSKNKPKKA